MKGPRIVWCFRHTIQLYFWALAGYVSAGAVLPWMLVVDARLRNGSGFVCVVLFSENNAQL